MHWYFALGGFPLGFPVMRNQHIFGLLYPQLHVDHREIAFIVLFVDCGCLNDDDNKIFLIIVRKLVLS